ncbi:MAG: 6-carboxytetrahydropterin synthase QueD [Spirochaetales bacterium]|nr:6-carboxytetrahydropterin synthase QueD [Spirochaetales bacterium]
MYEVSVHDYFASAHFLPNYNGKCENIHGHNYKVILTVRGTELDESGMLADFAMLKQTLKKLLDEFDHKLLNDLPWFASMHPSAENIARTVFEEISAVLPDINLHAVEVRETEKNRAKYIKE